MKKMSKTLLSMALVIAMVLSIMPMSFADGGETTSSGITISYRTTELVNTSMKTDSSVTGEFKNAINYTTTNDFFEFVTDATNDGVNTKYGITDPGLNFFRYYNGGWIIFKINVPVAGVYKIKTNNNIKTNGTMLSSYIFPTTVTPNASALADPYFVGKIDCDKDNAGTTGGWKGTTGGYDITVDTANYFTDTGLQSGTHATYNFTDAGEYYIGFKATGNDRVYFSNIYLVSGDGNGNALIGDMTISPDSVKAGETATASATAYKSDDASLANLTYASLNEDIATVDAATGVITTKKAGKATITATAAGSVNSLSKELTVTSANASDVTVTYDFMKNAVMGGSTPHAELYTYETTNGFFRYVFDGTEDKYFNWQRKFVNNTLQLAYNRYEIFEIDVPVAGEYDVKVKYGTDAKGDDMNVYLFEGDVTEAPTHLDLTDATKIGTVNCYDSSDAVATNPTPTVQKELKNLGPQTLKKGKYYFAVWTKSGSGYGFLSGLTLDGGDGSALMGVGEKELTIGETDTVNAYLSSTAEALTENVTYVSDNTAVAEVSENGTVVAKAKGNANITVTYSGDAEIVGSKSFTTKVSVKHAKTDFVSVAIDDDGDGNVTITSAELGEDVTATAKVPEGKVFRGWVRGSADNGRLVSTESTYTFKAMTNIYLTAVYTAVPTVETDEYYNWDGQFLGNTEPDSVPSLVGYTFAKTWTKAKVEDLITSYIADFTKNDADYEVTANGFTVTKEDNKYDTEVTCTADSAVYWYRDGKLVDYGTEYKFFIWDNTTVTTSNEGHNGAKLMLDKAKGNSYMVEYDAGNATLLEVGILFGATGETPTVERCQEKMSSQRENFTHGQFTATSDYAVARGYLIYKDGDSYRVIYAD